MGRMKTILCSMICWAVLCFFPSHGAVSVAQQGDWVTISNEHNTLSFNLGNGLYFIKDAREAKVVDYAWFQMGGRQSKDADGVRTFSSEDIDDELGRGKSLTVRVAYEGYADTMWRVSMYDGSPYVVFDMGLVNDTGSECRVTAFKPLASRQVYVGQETAKDYKVLDGHGGGARTLVRSVDHAKSFNNMLVRFGETSDPHILVAGGLSYREFEKFVTVWRQADRLVLDLFADDPVGRVVAPGETWMPGEKFYFCVNNDNPFEALELYGRTLQQAQDIRLNYYDYPTECLWYASFYNNEPGRPKFNDTNGAVEEMKRAVASGITRYTRVAIRLVPDAYSPDNQQGWWDDEHWAMYGDGMSTVGPHYAAPLLTTKSWAGAVRELGGIPLTYFQGARRSEDYAKAHPGHMLFNDPMRNMNQPERLLVHVQPSEEYGQWTIMGYGYFGHYWSDRMLWGYDFTDPGFIGHMRDVYRNLSEAGIAGLMYDYPDLTGWAYEGGFEDRAATTASAYRAMYRLAYEGLGPGCYLDERNLLRGSDITLGLVASQRVWADTDGITPEMVTRCGLRWYKNRVVVNYDMDAKDPTDALPETHSDGNRSMLTMCYVTSGRFLLGRSFGQLSAEQIRDMGRTFPYHDTPLSARPLDAFTGPDEFCRVYDFPVTGDWHQLAFYNPDLEQGSTLSVALCASLNEGGMALDSEASYHAYDFWNDAYIGLLPGDDTLSQDLRPGEARMISVRRKLGVPQYISTSRHLMQGYIDMKDCSWSARDNSLRGTADILAGEANTIVIAANGHNPLRASASQCRAELLGIEGHPGLFKLILTPEQDGDTAWCVEFEPVAPGM